MITNDEWYRQQRWVRQSFFAVRFRCEAGTCTSQRRHAACRWYTEIRCAESTRQHSHIQNLRNRYSDDVPNSFFVILNQLLTEPLHWRILSRSIHKGSIYSFIRRLFTPQAERDQWNNTISYAQQNWRQTNIFKNIAKFITIWDLKESLKSR